MKDMLEAGIVEPYLVKHWGIKMATNAAITVLRVDQVCRKKTLMTLKALTTAKLNNLCSTTGSHNCS